MNKDYILTLEQIIQTWGISERLLLNSIRSGELKAKRLGVTTLVLLPDFYKFVENNDRIKAPLVKQISQD